MFGICFSEKMESFMNMLYNNVAAAAPTNNLLVFQAACFISTCVLKL